MLEYSWSIGNKQEGILLYYINKRLALWNLEFIPYMLSLAIKITFYLMPWIFKSLYLFLNNYKNSKILLKLLNFIFGFSVLFKLQIGTVKSNLIEELKVESQTFDIPVIPHTLFDFIEYMATLKTDLILNRYLFATSVNALSNYDGFDNILLTLKFKHSINMEYIFGLFPTAIISCIIVPSMYLLYSNETDINPCITIKVIGHQWYWSYESVTYQLKNLDTKMFISQYNFDSIIINAEDLAKGEKRLLETDKSLVLPYNVVVRFLIHQVMYYIHEHYLNLVLK